MHMFLISRLVVVGFVLLGSLFQISYAQEANVSQSEGGVATSSNFQYPSETLLGNDNEVFGDFVVGPGKIELEIKPGESKTIEVTVSNRTGIPRVFEIGAEDAQGSTDPTQTLTLLGDDQGPYTMKDYVSVPVKRFLLPHNERARIPVTITIPPNAEPGGRYGSMLVSTVSQEARAGNDQGTASQSAVVARIGALFFITIPGDVARDGSLKKFSTLAEKKVFQQGPVHFGILYENRGNIHMTPYGEMRITNMFGREVGFQELEPWFVLPKSLRLREIEWDRELLFGRYTATVLINRSYDDVIDEMSYSFWVLPWKPLAGVFVLLFIVFFMFRTFFKTFEFRRKSS